MRIPETGRRNGTGETSGGSRSQADTSNPLASDPHSPFAPEEDDGPLAAQGLPTLGD